MSVFRSGSKALITGGASGIGLAVAQSCLKHGMRVSIVDFNQETLDLAKSNLKGEVECLRADVSQEKEWEGVKQKVGDVDFLMLNAGTMAKGTWGDAEYFQKVCTYVSRRTPYPTTRTASLGSAYRHCRPGNKCGG